MQTSTVFKILTWNSEIICSAWSFHVCNIFCVDQSIIFWRGALLNKIKWHKLYFSSFPNIDLKLLTYIRHEVYMWITYFSSGSVHYFLEGNDLTKSWMRTNTFSRYWLETVIIKWRCGQNIFYVDQSILFLKGAL
jgi:hypothetical protein